ncbi:MAG: peptide chain release factor N(5)-glutamine methyltransferase, partial [Alphaproteobacteria bacterium]|nr:peptide chain release factor N(5)-glutamine methyltransferase [Alphaproteobacteria bacterium]
MNPPLTLDTALGDAVGVLKRAGIPAPAFEARALACGILGLSREAMLSNPGQPLDRAAARRFAVAIRRRAAREPLARITGRREFWSLDIALGPDTLIPRPESETVVEAALEGVADREAELRILDLGTGSGCLLLALLTELPAARGLGVDRSPGAAAVARANANRLGLSSRAVFCVGDWGAALDGVFDVIVANPPYVVSAERRALAPEVRDFEPVAALDGGTDGLDAYRALMPELARLLAAGGIAVVELGAGQQGAVARIAQNAGLTVASA